MRTLLSPLVLLALLPAPVALAAPAEQLLDVTGTITEVTVYPDRAQITRVAPLTLAAGTYRVRFNRLPVGLLADSVRVGGQGSAQALLHGFDLKTTYLGESPDKQVAGLEGQLTALNDRDRALADERGVHERQLALLQATAARTGESLATQLAAGKAKIAEWQALLGFLKAQQSLENAALQSIDKQRRALTTQRESLRQQLQKLKGFRREQVMQAPVTVEVTQGGTLALALEYVIPAASWTPAYDARLDARGEKLDWRYYGVVRQQTGEDWNHVKLKLSTARPSSGSQPPTVPSWFIGLNQPQPEGQPGQLFRQNQMNRNVATGSMADEAMAPAPVMAEAVEPQAVVTDQGSSITLDVTRAVDIPSDGEPHQTPIGQTTFTPKIGYKVIPRVSPEAYLIAEAKQTGPWPILPGPAKAFVGHDYVGTTPITQDLVPGQTFFLPMGVDRGIQVRRSRLAKRQGESGLLKKVGFSEYLYEVTLTNFKPKAQSLSLIEAIPQVTDESISVQLTELSHPPVSQNALPGQVRWDLSLAPGEKRVVRWGYRVEYPQGTWPSGLE